jgi:peptide/nickel transport system permease protein
MREIVRQPNSMFVRGTGAVLSLFLFSLLSYWKWRIILASFESLVLTPSTIFDGHANSSRFLRTELVEYWIAGLAWITIFIVLTRNFIRVFFRNGRAKTPTGSNFHPGTSAVAGNKGLYPVLAILLVALLAPYLVPFDPAAQGDLRMTRLLKPLDKGVMTGLLPSTQESSRSDSAMGSLERMLDQADNVLLWRQERFTRWTESATMEGGEDLVQVKPFLLGTDDLGRDNFSRLIYGVRISFLCGVTAMLCAVFVGSVIGFAAGIAGGWIDTVLMRMTDLFLSIPSIFLVIALVAFFGNSILLLILVLAVTGWMSVARIVRAEVLRLREREFVLAARLLGRSSFRIVRDHMIPNVLPIIAAASVMQLGNVILAEAALSFLGVGIQPPTPSLGNMIGESFNYIDRAWWMGVFPGIALSGIVVSVNLFAEQLQQKAHATP